MDLRPKLQIQTMIKAMTDVVLPAVDPNNQLACEQAQIVLGMLHLMAARLPWQFRYDVDELDRALNLSADILVQGRGGEDTQNALRTLEHAAKHGDKLLSAAKVSSEELEDAILALRTQTSEVIRALWVDGDSNCRESIGRAVLNASKEQIDRERAWFAPQAWDSEENAPASLETFLGPLPSDIPQSNKN